MVITFYHCPISSPSRGALLSVKAAKIDVDIEIFDLLKREQLNPDFLKINPQHTVPTIVDGDFVLWESKAIATYLISSYGKNKDLYPINLRERAIVDQRLQFDSGVLHPRMRAICRPILYGDEIEVPDELKAPLDEALGFLDVFLEGHDFACGKQLTIADCFLAATVTNISAMGWNISAYGNINSWLAKCALAIPEYEEINVEGAKQFGKAVKSKMAPGQL